MPYLSLRQVLVRVPLSSGGQHSEGISKGIPGSRAEAIIHKQLLFFIQHFLTNLGSGLLVITKQLWVHILPDLAVWESGQRPNVATSTQLKTSRIPKSWVGKSQLP